MTVEPEKEAAYGGAAGPRSIEATWTCQCGRTVLWRNRENHLLRQDGRKHADPPSETEVARAAERVCLLVGWTPSSDSPRGKALFELWVEWKTLYEAAGGSLEPKRHPDLSDDRIEELAARRDATRAATLARLGWSDSTEAGPPDVLEGGAGR